jgi:hypothetical protein
VGKSVDNLIYENLVWCRGGDFSPNLPVHIEAELILGADLRTSVPESETVVNRLRRESFKERVKIIFGRAAVSEWNTVLMHGPKTLVDGLGTCKDWEPRGETNGS